MKFVAWMRGPLVLFSLSGCATGGSYCELARVIRPSVNDRMTPETEKQILTENEKLAAICGVKP
ncbi:hypothetical protein [Shinella zoogloeoides]|uniref:hypothetical protein n=1 Tax=Shinella zoogloeoides TaxID=352475 RepID=UPI00299E783C|nr:hypothetical protein [Shinella zoogloeoides]WPE19976.1 hypothetical protein ShzoTeo12_11560 [Shinella zoogloeoides]